LNEGPRPTSERERIADIDVLRGMALAGVLVSNLVETFRTPMGRQYRVPGSGPADDAVDFVMGTFFQGNTITLTFAAVFGLGMAISAERLSATGAYRVLAKRQLILLAIGLLHGTLLWHGDVLTSYAVVGLCALPFLRQPPRVLLAVALAVAILFCLPIYAPRFPHDPAERARRVAEALEAYPNGSWVVVEAQRLRDFRDMWKVAFPHWVFAELMAFCLGMAAWRARVIQDKPRRLLHGLLLAGIPSVALAILSYTRRVPSLNAPSAPFPLKLLYLAAYTNLGFAYGAGIVLLLGRPFWRRWLLLVAPMGQMTLSNYLMQSIVFGFVFYGYGLGQYGRWPTAITAAGGVAFYLLQAFFSAAWLRRFRFGPAEWAWRSLNYGSWQPFAKAPQ